MEREVRYVCPVHNNVVLFTETPSIYQKMMLFEKTKTCQKCNKSYFKEQCKKIE